MAMTEAHKSNAGRYVVVYLCILVIAALQFVIAYSNVTGEQMFTRMMFLAIIESALALLFFMHLADNRGLKWFVVIFTVAVILGMQYGWTDSFRLLDGAPWAKIGK
jgi:caa(3)-type oxidase subunit IV